MEEPTRVSGQKRPWWKPNHLCSLATYTRLSQRDSVERNDNIAWRLFAYKMTKSCCEGYENQPLKKKTSPRILATASKLVLQRSTRLEIRKQIHSHYSQLKIEQISKIKLIWACKVCNLSEGPWYTCVSLSRCRSCGSVTRRGLSVGIRLLLLPEITTRHEDTNYHKQGYHITADIYRKGQLYAEGHDFPVWSVRGLPTDPGSMAASQTVELMNGSVRERDRAHALTP